MLIAPDVAVELFNSLSGLLRSARSVAQRSRDVGATGTSLGVLKTLQQGDARPGDLAAVLRVDRSVISRVVAPLEQQRLVERKVDPVDARASLLGLTELGAARLADLQGVFVEQLRQTLGSWTDDEVEQAAVVLDRLESALASYQPPEHHRHQLQEALLGATGAGQHATDPPSTPSSPHADARHHPSPTSPSEEVRP